MPWVRPTRPAIAVDDVLHAAFPQGADKRFRDWRAPLWIELTAGPGRAEWEKVRREALAALNRRRSALEKECPRPLFPLLPVAMAPEIVTWAPDLWSIRQYVAILPGEEARAPVAIDDPE